MKCDKCGKKYKVWDAKWEFDRYTEGQLHYEDEIEGHLCGECAIDYMASISHTLYLDESTGELVEYIEPDYDAVEAWDPSDDY